ncbi:MAG: glycosyltransferase family 4 protein [Fimbriimonas sp.]|nr:glycosyltransferase family 4 protein [Fimbriimonas sp.]
MTQRQKRSRRENMLWDSQNQEWGTSRIPAEFLHAIKENDHNHNGETPVGRIAIIGNYLPRQCGIATFTGDLAHTLSSLDSNLAAHVVAMSDQDGYDYPERVRFEIKDDEPASYGRAAEFLNRSHYEVLSIQHEYGIFGGEAGCYLMDLVRSVKMPIVTTLHTVLGDPSKSQKKVMDELLHISGRVVVMSQKAVEFLTAVHGISRDKIDLIPHGIPSISKEKGLLFRSKLGIEGPLILTFGLLSPDKGIQFVIQAMPHVLKEHPGSTYVVVGATHPKVRASVGEAYRASLVELANDLGVASNVRFVDRFVALDELVEYLGAMDIYVTPYLNPRQITSGTLAYAVGAGKAVISTGYWYAEELLADGRGLLVPFSDAIAIADAVLSVQRDPEAKHEMGRKAAEYGKQMLWPEVGRKYIASFAKAKREISVIKMVPAVKPWPSIGSPVHLPTTPFPGIQAPIQLGPSGDWPTPAPWWDQEFARPLRVEHSSPRLDVDIAKRAEVKSRLTES